MAKALRTTLDASQALSASEALVRLGVSVSKGLADGEVREHQKVIGSNTVASPCKTSGLAILLHQFHSPVVYLLGAAAALAFYFGELEESAAIAIVLAVNGLIGLSTELKAARSIEALRALGSRSARVRRDGHARVISAQEMIPVFPAFALAMGEGEPGILRRPPRNPKEPILGRSQWIMIVLHRLVLAAGTFGALAAARLWLELDSRSVITVTFLTLAFAQLWHSFNMHHPKSGLFRNEATQNPWLWDALLLCTALLAVPPYLTPMADVLHLVPPTPIEWSLILGLSAVPLLMTQIVFVALLSPRTGA